MLVVHSPPPIAAGELVTAGASELLVVTGTTVAVTSTTGQTVVPMTTVSVVTWPKAGQLVTVGAHEVTVYTVVLYRVLVVRLAESVGPEGEPLSVCEGVVWPPVVVVLLL